MKSIIKLYYFTLFFLVGCGIPNEKKNTLQENIPKIYISIDRVSCILINKSELIYYINNKDSLQQFLNEINNSNVEYIVFGSADYFEIYDLEKQIILKAPFRKNKFKVNGVTYRTNNNLFH